MPAPISDAPTWLSIAPRSVPMSTVATISGRPVAPKNASAAVSRPPRLTEPEERRRAADDEQEHEEDRRQDEPARREEAVEVEVHARGDEVDGDQEAEADALEAHPYDGSVRRLERQPHDQPGGERAEHEVEADVPREQHERREHEDREPDRGLPCRVHGLLQDTDDAGRASP